MSPQSPNPSQQPTEKPWYKTPIVITLLIIIVALVVIILLPFLFFAACTALVSNSIDDKVDTEYPVTYRVIADAQDADIAYDVQEANTIQQNSVQIQGEWSEDSTISGIFGAYLMATNGADDNGQITCQIEANGKVLTEETSSGRFAVVTCRVSYNDLQAAFEE